MKKQLNLNGTKSTLNHRKRLSFLVLFIAGVFLSQPLFAQSYTYTPESFEENVWSLAANSFNDIVSSTGKWTTAKNNIQSTVVTAQSGTYSFLFATKTAALVTPRLDNGAGVLTYYTMKTSSRSVIVETSTDNVIWTSVDTYASTSAWTQRTVNINNAAVRYIRFSTGSNGGLHLDNVLITDASPAGLKTTTLTPTEISQTSALVGGNTVNTGSSTITSRGICYNTTGSPDINSSKIEIAGTTGDFTTQLTGLSKGTIYYVKAYTQTNNGISYGLSVPFSTRADDAPVNYWTQPFNDPTNMPGSAPTVAQTINVAGQGDWIYLNAYKDGNAVYITDGSASCLRMLKTTSYIITPLLDAGVTKVTFTEGRGDRTLTVYTSTDGGISWSNSQDVVSVKGELITISINSASVNRIKIANLSGGDADIDNITVNVFPTGTPPSLTTAAATAIGKNTAAISGEITDAGSKTMVERGFVWSTNVQPLLIDNKIALEAGTGVFTGNLTGLPAGTLIHARAYAISRAGTGYGNEITFTTIAPTIPVLTTTTATAVKGELATSGGNITDEGGAAVSVRGVCWNTTGNPIISDSKSTDETGSGTYQSALTYLTPNTKYYYRAYATNIAGTGYGEVLTLNTISVGAPAVTTTEVSDIYFYKATAGGTITDDGNAMTERGVCWNTTGNPTLTDNHSSFGIGAGSFSGTISNLTENMQYYLRAYAKNSAGTVYGNQVLFVTPVSNKLSSPIGYAAGTTGGGKPTAENTITVTTATDLANALSGTKSVILVSGTITTNKITATIQNKSIIGLPGARLVNLNQTAEGSGILHITEGSRNVIIQNLTFEGPGAYDADGWDLLTNKGCYKLWVDHCNFQDGMDDCFDNTNNSDSITVSWCKFSYLKPAKAGGSGGSADHRFVNLIGGSDSDIPTDGKYNLTFYNNWYAEGCVSRMIRSRNAEVHMLNNYWSSQVGSSIIGMTAGVSGASTYVEGGVFACTGTISDLAAGCTVKFVDCVGGKANIGTVNKPSYDYVPMSSGEVISALTNTTCGAGATLWVTTNGEVYSGCPTIPVLTATSNTSQEVFGGNAITNIIYTWGGTATDVTVTQLPAGLIATKDAATQKLTISGIPTSSGSFTVTTVGGAGLPTSKTGNIIITSTPPPTLSSTGTLSQTVVWGSATTAVVFTWGGGATDVSVENLPRGLVTTKDLTAKTLTISGTPTGSGAYTVTTIGGSGDKISINASVNIKYGTGTSKIAYVTNNSSATYTNDTRILASLKDDPNFTVTEISSATAGNDYSSYDLVIFSEVAGSTDAGTIGMKGVNKPFIMMKVHAYKSEAGAWNWTASTTAYGQSATDTRLAVTDKSHPIFKDVNWINDNEVEMLSAVSSLKGITFMDPTQFKSVSGGTIKSLATIIGQPTQVSILQIPAGTTVAGTLIQKPFMQIGLNSNSYSNVTADGISIIKNSCFYLLGVISGIQQPTYNNVKVDVYPTRSSDAINIKAETAISSIKVIALDGRTVAAISPNVEFTVVHVNSLPNGIYALVINTKEGFIVTKIQVAK
jgi:pectate lyase